MIKLKQFHKIQKIFWPSRQLFPLERAFPVEAHFHSPCFILISCGILRNPAANPESGKKFGRSFGILLNVELWFCSDFSGQIIGAIYKGQVAQDDSQEDWNVSAFLDCLTLEDRIDRLSRNVCAKLPFDTV